MKRSLLGYVIVIAGILLSFQQARAKATQENCPDGFVFIRMSGQCCVQRDTTLPEHGLIGYVGNSYCADGYISETERRRAKGPVPGCPGQTTWSYLLSCKSREQIRAEQLKPAEGYLKEQFRDKSQDDKKVIAHIGQVVGNKSQVQYWNPNKKRWIQAGKGTLLTLGAKVRTGPNVRVVIYNGKSGNDERIDLRPDSHITFGKVKYPGVPGVSKDHLPEVQLAYGALAFYHIARVSLMRARDRIKEIGNPEGFSVFSPTVATGIRGTRFAMTYSPKSRITRILVESGEVEGKRLDNGRSTRLKGGQMATFKPSGTRKQSLDAKLWKQITGGALASATGNSAGHARDYASEVANLSAPNEVFVRSLYRSVLHREPDSGGLATWVRHLERGQKRGWVVSRFLFSQEYRSHRSSNRNFVRDCYQAILGREPDKGGWSHWSAKLDRGQSRESIVQGFLASQEYHSRSGGR